MSCFNLEVDNLALITSDSAMNSIKLFFPFILLLTLLFACQEEESIELVETNSGLNLRIENATEARLDSIVSNNHYFGTLESGEVSDYVEFVRIYQWPDVSCKEGENYYFWTSPVDNIGYWFSFYEEGDYTLVITGIGVDSPVLIEAHIEED